MKQLKSSDNIRLLECVREIYSNLDKAALPDHIIRSAARLISSPVISYARIENKGRSIRYAGLASCRQWEALDGFVRNMDEHPVLNFLHQDRLKPHRFGTEIEQAVQRRFPSLRQAQHYTAARISDALSDRWFKSLEIYNEFFRKNGVDHQMLISFLPERKAYSLISFNRDKLDFTERERLLLNLLAPHIAQATVNAEVHAAARRTFSALHGPQQPLRSHGLTYREEDVLYWVSQGKTNAEVARILRIAPGTVKVHLERIYEKLGVENRTAASMLAGGINFQRIPG